MPAVEVHGRHLTWQFKAATLCNLRCRYCYEWDRLADTSRISLSNWHRILRAAADHRAIVEQQLGYPIRLLIVLHGGEPLLLPVAYLSAVDEMRRQMLGEDSVLAIQTNLTVLNEQMLAFIAQSAATLSVSWDGTPDARLDLANQPTHERVLVNIDRQRALGIRYGVNLVLGVHNHRKLAAIYDLVEARGASWLNVIPVLQSSTPESTVQFTLSYEATSNALAALFEHWKDRGRGLAVMPILRCVETLARSGRRLALPPIPRITVHPDCSVSIEAGTSSQSAMLGNLCTDSIEQILESARFAGAMLRQQELYARHCATCKLEGVCIGSAVVESPHDFPAGPCPIELRLCEYIRGSLLREGLTADELLGWTEMALDFEAALEP